MKIQKMHSKKLPTKLFFRLVEGMAFCAGILVVAAIVFAATAPNWDPGSAPLAAPGEGNVELAFNAGAETYGIVCLEGVDGRAWPSCFKLNKQTGEVNVKQANSWGFSQWLSRADVFSASTDGSYGLTCAEGIDGKRYAYCCRINITGSAECKQANDWGLSGWTDVSDPW